MVRAVFFQAVSKRIGLAVPGVLLGLLLGMGSPLLSGPLRPVQAQTSSELSLSQLENILQEEGTSVQGSDGQWQLMVNGQELIVLADANNNRMRILAPVASANELSGPQVQAMLLANFHTALDARYALSDGTVVALFVHPLSSLDTDYLRSALSQVSTLATTFGTTYSSGALGFTPGEQSGDFEPGNGDRLQI